MSDFSMSIGFYWSSSPYKDDQYSAWHFTVNDNNVATSFGGLNRSDSYRVRCLKDSVLNPQPLNYRWQTDSTCSSDENDYTPTSRDSYVV